MQGSLISSVLIFLVLFVGYVWDQVRLYWIVRQDELQWEQERQQQVMVPQVTDCPWSPVCCYIHTLSVLYATMGLCSFTAYLHAGFSKHMSAALNANSCINYWTKLAWADTALS